MNLQLRLLLLTELDLCAVKLKLECLDLKLKLVDLILLLSHLGLGKAIRFMLCLPDFTHMFKQPIFVPFKLFFCDKQAPVNHLQHVALKQIHFCKLHAADLAHLLIRKVDVIAVLRHKENGSEDDPATSVNMWLKLLTDVL